MTEENERTSRPSKWYRQGWGIILFLILFFPIGLYLMWRYSGWSLKVKGIVTGIFLLFMIIGFNSNPTPNRSQSSPVIQEANSDGEANREEEKAPTSTVRPKEKFNIVVSSQIVKRVDGKHRYFFDIRNNDTKSFEGSVTISLFTNTLKNPIAGDTFKTTRAIEPTLGTSVYADANTGPTSVHGENGITKFRYVVKRGEDIVNSGEGVISDKFEDIDSYGF